MQSLPKKPGADANPTSKKSKLYNSRQIRTQLKDDAYTNPPKGATLSQQLRKMLNNGSLIPNKLQISDFVASREFEIKALDSAMVKSKTSGASRVFQSLPRTLRRRTASHNVRRIPKRMRKKALREMGLYVGKAELGTKGVTVTGKPLKKKIGRGRSRWEIIRRIKLLKYAAKWKLKGRLPDSTFVSMNQINLRKRMKMLKKDLEKLNKNTDENKEIEYIKNNTVKQETIKLKQLSEKIYNSLGHYDNTSVNRVSKTTKVTCIKYATRQKDFKWTPSHIWHSKRAKMMKRWGWTLPLEPTQRCFRSTSRSARLKGAVAFDTSYMGSLVINIYDKEKFSLVQKYLANITNEKLDLKSVTKKGVAWEGYIYTDINRDPAGTTTIVSIETDEIVTVLVRLHPSIYVSIFEQIVKEFNDIENISIHDCNYSLGSLDITGPETLSALQSIFYNNEKSPAFIRFMNLHRLNDLQTVPDRTVFTFDVRDPRFLTRAVTPVNPHLSYNDELDLIISLKKNQLDNKLLLPEARTEMYRNQLSLKQLGQRRNLYPGEAIPVKENDASISIMLIKNSGNWTVILPWFWVLPFWHTLMHVPHVQFGGFKQVEQLRLERGLLGWSDMVFTDSGYIQSLIEKDENERKWNKRPKSKRVEYSKLKIHDELLGEILSPFGLDWRGLQTLRLAHNVFKNSLTVNGENSNFVPAKDEYAKVLQVIQKAETQIKLSGKDSLLVKYKPISLRPTPQISEPITFNIPSMPALAVTPIRFTCCSKGNIEQNARLYSIPKDQHEFWVEIGTGNRRNIRRRNIRHLAIDDKKPSISDLVGLVTSATFNLTDGRYSGVAFIDSEVKNEPTQLLLARNVGSNSYYVIKFSEIE